MKTIPFGGDAPAQLRALLRNTARDIAAAIRPHAPEWHGAARDLGLHLDSAPADAKTRRLERKLADALFRDLAQRDATKPRRGRA